MATAENSLGKVIEEFKVRGSAFGIRALSLIICALLTGIIALNMARPFFPNWKEDYQGIGLGLLVIFGILTLASLFNVLRVIGRRVVVYEGGVAVGRGRNLTAYRWPALKGVEGVREPYRLGCLPVARSYAFSLIMRDNREIAIPAFMERTREMGELIARYIPAMRA